MNPLVDGWTRADAEAVLTHPVTGAPQAVSFNDLRPEWTVVDKAVAADLGLAVDAVNIKGKTKRFGRSIGRRDHVKKAYVSLKEGQQLNFSGEAA